MIRKDSVASYIHSFCWTTSLGFFPNILFQFLSKKLISQEDHIFFSLKYRIDFFSMHIQNTIEPTFNPDLRIHDTVRNSTDFMFQDKSKELHNFYDSGQQ